MAKECVSEQQDQDGVLRGRRVGSGLRMFSIQSSCAHSHGRAAPLPLQGQDLPVVQAQELARTPEAGMLASGHLAALCLCPLDTHFLPGVLTRETPKAHSVAHFPTRRLHLVPSA